VQTPLPKCCLAWSMVHGAVCCPSTGALVKTALRYMPICIVRPFMVIYFIIVILTVSAACREGDHRRFIGLRFATVTLW
jgi:hypothetical protein